MLCGHWGLGGVNWLEQVYRGREMEMTMKCVLDCRCKHVTDDSVSGREMLVVVDLEMSVVWLGVRCENSPAPGVEPGPPG